MVKIDQLEGDNLLTYAMSKYLLLVTIGCLFTFTTTGVDDANSFWLGLLIFDTSIASDFLFRKPIVKIIQCVMFGHICFKHCIILP